MPAVSSLSET